ncbi:MAG: permease, partial [Deltaproteobacteria bacterium]|nr:permease [Deltaproteobacteria bacterium]
MSTTIIFINLFALGCFVVALIRDRGKTKQSLGVAVNSFIRILPPVLSIIIIIGLLLAFVSPEQVSRFIGEQAGFGGILATALLGAILHIPAILSFPLAASLLQSGVSITTVATFITTLTMIGVLTLPLEIKELGKKMAILRNGLSFVIAIAIAFL